MLFKASSLRCSSMPFAVAQLYIPVPVSLRYKFLPVLGSITFIWDADSPA